MPNFYLATPGSDLEDPEQIFLLAPPTANNALLGNFSSIGDKSMIRTQIMAMLVKAESTYGTDPTPTAADLVMVKDCTISTFEGSPVERNFSAPFYTSFISVHNAKYTTITCKYELVGAGTIGAGPFTLKNAKWYEPLQSFGFLLTEGSNASASAVEDKLESSDAIANLKSFTLYYYHDGVIYKVHGARATAAKLTLSPNELPYLEVTWTGIDGGRATGAMVSSLDFSGFPVPGQISDAKTLARFWVEGSGNGILPFISAFELDFGVTGTYQNLIGEERVVITNRQVKGSMTIEDDTANTFYNEAFNGTQSAMKLLLKPEIDGTGRNILITLPYIQLQKPGVEDKDGISMLNMPFVATVPLNTASAERDVKIEINSETTIASATFAY